MRTLKRVAAIIWASPYTLMGMCLGGVVLITGGRMQVRGPAVEFFGGASRRLLRCLPNGRFILALTLGHTIIGQTADALDTARNHEYVHVRQFERWGLLMGPAYLISSLVLWATGRDPYWDNPFEQEAFDEST